jgi:hypothetical protein
LCRNSQQCWRIEYEGQALTKRRIIHYLLHLQLCSMNQNETWLMKCQQYDHEGHQM